MQSNNSEHEDSESPQKPKIEGRSGPYHDGPSSDFLASVHTVELDRGGHTEKRSLNFFHTDRNERIRPGDSTSNAGSIQIPREKLQSAGADPESVFVAVIRPDANIDAPAGSKGVFEKVGSGRVRFLGTVDELDGRRLSSD